MTLEVHKLTVIEGQQLMAPVSKTDAKALVWIDETARAGTWPTPRVKLLLEQDDGQSRSSTDFPFLGDHVLILRARAHSSLRAALRPAGEFLPLACEAEPLWLFNTTLIVPALDLERSDVERFSDGGVSLIRRHVFRPESLAGLLVFKLPDIQTLYMTSDFLALVDRSGLTGLGAELVWSG